jgi:hypothetical protein
MQRTKVLVLACLAILAVTAVASASASAALPEFVPGEGNSFPVTLEHPSNGTLASKFETTASLKWECQGLKVAGVIASAKGGPLTIELEACHQSGTTTKCQSEGYPKGQIAYTGTGSLVYINKAKGQVGIVLALNEAHLVCGSLSIKVRGSLIIPVTPLNILTRVINWKLAEANGKQEYTTYENETGEIRTAHLELNFGTGFLQMGLTVGEEVKVATSKPLTIEA